MSAAVFLGPSLSRAEAEAILAADYLPPVRQGDIYRLVRERRPEAIAIIDGYFQEVPSVWHKEILWAIDQGIPVFGAASMGALRAAELDRHGMVGVGKVYEAYSSGCYVPYGDEVFEDDDEVAVIHGPAELNYPALSDAMVDLRETLAAAAHKGVIDPALRDRLVAAFKRRFYHNRSFEALPEVLDELGVAAGVGEALHAWLPQGRVSQKRADALALLEKLTGAPLEPPSASEPFVFERTTLWAQFVEQTDEPVAAISEAERAALEELKLDPDLYQELCGRAALWLRLEMGEALPPTGEDARRDALDRLRRRQGLLSREQLETWAEDCNLDRAGLQRLLDYEASLEACIAEAGPMLDRALLDVLRSEERYMALAGRARNKQRLLEQTEETVSAPSALSSAALLDWYFETHLGRGVPGDVARYAEVQGFGGVKELLAAVARERSYQKFLAAEKGRGQ